MESEKNTDNLNITDLISLKKFLTNNDNAMNAVYISEIPEICKTQPCMLGIDEAGRGPVLGPMVYGTAFCPIDNSDILKSLECADSKALNEEKRDNIFSNMCGKYLDKMGWGVEVIAPLTICNSMLSKTKYSLNQVSMDSAINLIKRVETAGVNISHIYVDTVGPPEKYQAYLKSLFPDYNITVAKKADSTYPIVSAASICAKVSRDHALKVWQFTEGHDLTYEHFGSGYPGDPTTKKFLVEHCDPVFGYPQLVRFSWSTASDALKREAYHVEWDDSEETIDTPSNNTSITSFFKMTPKKGLGRREHEFFTDRHLSRKVEL